MYFALPSSQSVHAPPADDDGSLPAAQPLVADESQADTEDDPSPVVLVPVGQSVQKLDPVFC